MNQSVSLNIDFQRWASTSIICTTRHKVLGWRWWMKKRKNKTPKNLLTCKTTGADRPPISNMCRFWQVLILSCMFPFSSKTTLTVLLTGGHNKKLRWQPSARPGFMASDFRRTGKCWALACEGSVSWDCCVKSCRFYHFWSKKSCSHPRLKNVYFPSRSVYIAAPDAPLLPELSPFCLYRPTFFKIYILFFNFNFKFCHISSFFLISS